MMNLRRDGGVYVIAEAGVNHNGSLDMAFRLADAACAAGADSVKYQAFTADLLVSRRAPKAAYQSAALGEEISQHDMLKALEFSPADFLRIRKHCEGLGIDFLCSAFDAPSLDFLVSELGQTRVKFGSGDLTDAPLLVRAARCGIEVLVSSGMSSLADVEAGLGALAFGYSAPAAARPGPAAFAEALASPQGRQALEEKVGLFHCTSNYPARLEDVNLRAMATLAVAFGVDVGYSDHTEGNTVAVAAVALGARMIEKHLTLDRALPGPDHAASLDPHAFADLVRAVRETGIILGHGRKVSCAAEVDTLRVARKSLVAAADVRAGEEFTELNLTVKRPGTGIAPSRYWELLGRPAGRDYHADDVIDSLP